MRVKYAQSEITKIFLAYVLLALVVGDCGVVVGYAFVVVHFCVVRMRWGWA